MCYNKNVKDVNSMFGEQLKQLRIKNKISQEELGETLGVRKSSISNWETNKATPTFEMLSKIASYFGVSIDYLLDFNQHDLNNIQKLQIALKEAGMMVHDDLTIEELEYAMKQIDLLRETQNKMMENLSIKKKE